MFLGAQEAELQWSELPNLPPAKKGEVQKGLAGTFAGAHNGALIVAGGANFPDQVPWKSGVKSYWNDIYVLVKGASGKPEWVEGVTAKIPKPIAYGASVSTDYGVLCIGGMDSSQCFADVLLLRWVPEKRDVEIIELPPLPTPLAFSTASRVGSVVYVAGGVTDPAGAGTKSFFALDLEPEDPDDQIPDEENSGEEGEPENADTTDEGSGEPGGDEEPDDEKPKAIRPEVVELPDGSKPEQPEQPEQPEGGTDKEPEEPEKELKPLAPLEWKALSPWNGSARAFAVSAAQSDGATGCFFLFSGRNPRADGMSDQLADTHKYNPAEDKWTQFPDIAPLGEKPRSVVAASANASGDRSILIFGGDDGTMAKIYALVAAAANSTSRDAYLKLNQTILDNHPGFSRDILSLDTVDGIWKNVGTFPEACPVTTRAVLWDSTLVIPSGEQRPGIRSVKVWQGSWK